MYSLTVIRINSQTNQFQNTEIHSLFLFGDVERELRKKNPTKEDIEKFESMVKGDSKTFEFQNEDKMWFYYLTRIN